MTGRLNPRNYYRLPWSLTDNGISWLEVTNSCNLACEGCYRPKSGGHKTLAQIAADLAVFKKERKSDCMSIAGGDPLVHPEIVQIVRMISECGWKPIINTNGLALTSKKLKKLKAAGAFGFTFHIDTSQDRRDSRVKTEGGHNALRQKFAKMLAAEGGLVCAFNQTVTSDTLDEIPEVVAWARRRPDIVHTIVFILYRGPKMVQEFDFFAGGKKVQIDSTYDKTKSFGGNQHLQASDVVEKIRQVEPDYEPGAYLNGTEDANSAKWLIATRLASGGQTFGFVSSRFMELVQQGHRALTGRWLSYSSPEFLSAGRSAMLGFSAVDSRMRAIAGKFMNAVRKKPSIAFMPVHLQTFTIIQPLDVLADGRMNMCDGCPDMTVHEGRMYWSCRLEELKQYGGFVNAVPKSFSTRGVSGRF
jgi:pyruvate-formate lyase-activating enzyme